MNEEKIEEKKACNKCGKVKAVTEFFKNKETKDGLCSQCKSCQRETLVKSKERLFQKHKKFQLENPIKRKRCSICKQEKNISEFFKSKSQKDGFRNWCKICEKQHTSKNAQRLIQEHKKYQEKNQIEKRVCCLCKKEKNINEFGKDKYHKDGFCGQCKDCQKQSHSNNKEKLIQVNKQWQLDHPITHKKCHECKETKLVNEFYKDEENKDGLQRNCKTCCSQLCKQHHLEHREEDSLKSRTHYLNHSKEISLKNRQHYSENKEEMHLKRQLQHIKHREQDNLKNKQHRSERTEEECIRDRIRERKNAKHKWETDASYRTLKNIRAATNRACKAQGVKKTMHTLELLDCTGEFFQNHLQSHFKPGMTKENNGKIKWHKHHIIEFNEVDLSDIEQLKRVCHYTNIIPMWEDEHMALHAKNPKRRKKISPINNPLEEC